MCHLVTYCHGAVGLDALKKKFIIRDTLWILVNARDSVTQANLKNMWSKIHPSTMLENNEDQPDNFGGYNISHLELFCCQIFGPVNCMSWGLAVAINWEERMFSQHLATLHCLHMNP